jgi:hypothetical protein
MAEHLRDIHRRERHSCQDVAHRLLAAQRPQALKDVYCMAANSTCLRARVRAEGYLSPAQYEDLKGLTGICLQAPASGLFFLYGGPETG